MTIIVDFLYPATSTQGQFSLVNFFQGFLVYLFTAAAVGFIVARKVGEDHMKVGVKTGYFAFALNMVMLLMHRTYFGALWIFFGYFVGGMIGGTAARLLSKREG